LDTTHQFGDRVALVTGSSTGIGRAIATGLANAGAALVAHWYTDPEGAHKLQREVGEDRCHLVYADLRNVVEIRRMYAEIDAWRPVDILINNAAITGWTPDVLATSEEQWDAVVDTNLKGTFFCSIEAARRMRERGGGSIVNISSNTAALGVPQLAVYGASKGGVNALTMQLAVDLSPFGIRVNAVAPGPTTVARTLRDDPEYPRTWAPLVPLGRAAEVDDIVGPALFLASDSARFVTGQVLYADGGWSRAGRIPDALAHPGLQPR
jgi:glucose 1-dehydrogenase